MTAAQGLALLHPQRLSPLNALNEALAYPSQGVRASLRAFRYIGGAVDTENLNGLVEDVATRYGYQVPRVQLKKLKRWFGICHTRENLVVLDRSIVESNDEATVTQLVKHELAHFKVLRHSWGFAQELMRMGLLVEHRELQGWYEVCHYNDPRKEKYGVPVQLGHYDVHR